MAAQKGISLKYKILGLMTMIPVLTLSTYLTVAITTFKDDKKSYIFESSSTVSRTLSAQVLSEFNAIIKNCRPIFQDFLNKNTFSEISSVILKNDLNLVAMSAYKKEEGKIVNKAIVEKTEGEFNNQFKNIPELIKWLYDALKDENDTIVKAPFKDDRIILIQRAGDIKDAQMTIFVIVTHLRELMETFQVPEATSLYLVNQNSSVIFGPEGTLGTQLSEKFDWSFMEKERSQAGVTTIKDTNGETFLIGYAESSFGDLMVVTTTQESKAYEAIGKLKRKSFWFFGMLVALVSIISTFASGSLTSALTSLFEATKKVAEGKFDFRIKINSTDEIGSLADSFNKMSAEVSRLLLETASKARMESELQTAKTVQETLFPASQANIDGFKIAGFYEPASECGGDWWHYCRIGDKIFLWIGDATGHGAPAALITSAAKSAATIIETLDGGPGKALSLLNRAIYDVSKGRIMMTFFVASFDLNTQEFVYSNASHEAPYLLKKGTTAPKKKDLIPLNDVNNPRLGQSRETNYNEVSIKLDVDDSILFYTDGIPDIQNKKQEPWGEREFIKAFLSANEDFPTPQKATERISEKFILHREKAPLIDDITFFICKFEGKEQVLEN
jgi:sigma-B regulation protein RsbU (phosphoserine phosphatase)